MGSKQRDTSQDQINIIFKAIVLVALDHNFHLVLNIRLMLHRLLLNVIIKKLSKKQAALVNFWSPQLERESSA